MKKQIKSFLIIMLMAMVSMAMLTACGSDSEEPDDFSDMENTAEAKEKAPGIGVHHAEIEIKDYGTIFPGHGGFLDRCDSIIFTAPIVLIINQYMPLLSLG